MLKLFMKFSILIPLIIIPLLAEERSFFLKHTNDLIFGVDRDYSTGTEIGIKLGENCYSILQDIYTPDQKQTSHPIQGEHPYAGWLAIKALHNYQFYGHPAYVALSLGTVGKRAKAKEVQRLFHQLIHNDEINGWDSQHPNQYGYILEFYNRYHTLYLDPFSHLSLGGVRQYWELGIHKSYTSNLLGREVAYWGELSTQYVDKNIFLEEDRNGYKVEKKRFVSTIQLGIRTHLGDYEIAITTQLSSRDYQTQKLPYGEGSLMVAHPF